MHWLNEAPVVSLDLVEEGGGRLVLSGPSSSTRREGAVNAAGGAAMALLGARFLRAPLPLLFPIAFLAMGTVSVVVGAARLTGRCTVTVGAEGVTFRWRLPPGAERSLHVPIMDIAWFQIKTRIWSTDNDHGVSDVREDFVLTLHTTDGRTIPFECFASRAAAVARRAAIEQVLLRA